MESARMTLSLNKLPKGPTVLHCGIVTYVT